MRVCVGGGGGGGGDPLACQVRVTRGDSGLFVCVVFVYRLQSANELPFFADAIPWVGWTLGELSSFCRAHCYEHCSTVTGF